MMDFQEGYADGLAGKGAQPRAGRSIAEYWHYIWGLAIGALDRIAMTDDAFARWMEGLA